MKNVLIVGGAGGIGSHLAERLVKEPQIERVVVFDNFSSGTMHNLRVASVSPKLEVVRGDAIVFECEIEREKLSKFDTVFMLASNPDISRAASEPTLDFDQGTALVQNVLEACRVAGVGLFVYASGSGAYPASGGPFKETDATVAPVSTYGASKIAGEALISAYHHLFGLNAIVLRFANVVSANMTHGVAYDFVRRLRANPETLRILGDGTQDKGYIHIDDVLSAIMHATYQCPTGHHVFNVAPDDTITVKTIADLACKALGFDPDNVVYEFGMTKGGWPGDVPKIKLDNSKLKALGWRPLMLSGEAVFKAMLSMRVW